MNPIVKKIQKLMGLAKNQAGRPEGETAAKLAHKLMVAHAITMAELSVEEQQEADPLEKQCEEKKTGIWRRELMFAISRHCNCKGAFTLARGDIGFTTMVTGATSKWRCISTIYARGK